MMDVLFVKKEKKSVIIDAIWGYENHVLNGGI